MKCKIVAGWGIDKAYYEPSTTSIILLYNVDIVDKLYIHR